MTFEKIEKKLLVSKKTSLKNGKYVYHSDSIKMLQNLCPADKNPFMTHFICFENIEVSTSKDDLR